MELRWIEREVTEPVPGKPGFTHGKVEKVLQFFTMEVSDSGLERKWRDVPLVKED